MRSARRSLFVSTQDGRHQEGSEMLPEMRTPAPRSPSSMELFVSSAESLLQRAVTHRQPWGVGSRRWRRRFKDLFIRPGERLTTRRQTAGRLLNDDIFKTLLESNGIFPFLQQLAWKHTRTFKENILIEKKQRSLMHLRCCS